MAIRDIIILPDKQLRLVSKKIEKVTPEVRHLADDMFETMYAAPGIGLAATQLDAHRRVIVIDVSKEHDQPVTLINPEIVSREGEAITEEGCLSVPGIFDEVKRAARVRVRSHDRKGQVHERDYDDILAVCIQHEMDHLLGKVFVDYLSPMKRARLAAKFRKKQRLAG
jgi:peptide deformylase